uniref:Uncharacterized protein LOC114340765 n=1 Tax=Diabrotica virgifera virgifera TaxID=50390 RepID=A0A6P7GU22_DIAVI
MKEINNCQKKELEKLEIKFENALQEDKREIEEKFKQNERKIEEIKTQQNFGERREMFIHSTDDVKIRFGGDVSKLHPVPFINSLKKKVQHIGNLETAKETIRNHLKYEEGLWFDSKEEEFDKQLVELIARHFEETLEDHITLQNYKDIDSLCQFLQIRETSLRERKSRRSQEDNRPEKHRNTEIENKIIGGTIQNEISILGGKTKIETTEEEIMNQEIGNGTRTGFINEKLIKIMIETGSEITLVNRKLIEEVFLTNLIYKIPRVNLVGANKRTLAKINEGIRIKVRLGKRFYALQCVIMPNMSHDMIVGVDELTEKHVVIDFKNNKMKLTEEDEEEQESLKNDKEHEKQKMYESDKEQTVEMNLATKQRQNKKQKR